MAGRLFDVWFVPAGRLREREKICVTMRPDALRESLPAKLEVMVKERYGDGRMHRSKGSRIEITDRPDGNAVYVLSWG